MKKSTFVKFVLIVCVLVFAACKTPNPIEPCNDPWNPDCDNYDPQWQLKQDFKLYKDSCLYHFVPMMCENSSLNNQYQNKINEYGADIIDLDSLEAARSVSKTAINNPNLPNQPQVVIDGTYGTNRTALEAISKAELLGL
jgi:hypothetical protein